MARRENPVPAFKGERRKQRTVVLREEQGTVRASTCGGKHGFRTRNLFQGGSGGERWGELRERDCPTGGSPGTQDAICRRNQQDRVSNSDRSGRPQATPQGSVTVMGQLPSGNCYDQKDHHKKADTSMGVDPAEEWPPPLVHHSNIV